MKVRRNKGFFSISAVAKMFSIHQQTIRWYEEKGLITPKRSDGNTRLFAEEDIDKLEEVIYLTHEMGINLAGVEMILKLKKQIKKMQKDMNALFEQTQKDLDQQEATSKQAIQSSAQRLSRINKQDQLSIDSAMNMQSRDNETRKIEPLEKKTIADSFTESLDHWQVEYEE